MTDERAKVKRTRQHGRVAGEFGRHKLHAGGGIGQRIHDAHHQRSQHDGCCRRLALTLALTLTLGTALRRLRLRLCLWLLRLLLLLRSVRGHRGAHGRRHVHEQLALLLHVQVARVHLVERVEVARVRQRAEQRQILARRRVEPLLERGGRGGGGLGAWWATRGAGRGRGRDGRGGRPYQGGQGRGRRGRRRRRQR